MSKTRAARPVVLDAVFGEGVVEGDVLELPADDPAWLIEVDDGPESRLRIDESMLALADGVVGTRGSLEEDGHLSDPLAYAAGVYDEHQQLVELPSWTTVEVGELWPTGRRVLDLADGVLRRQCLDPDGRSLRTARFACLARPGVGVLVAEIAPGGPDRRLNLDRQRSDESVELVERRGVRGGVVAITRTGQLHEPGVGGRVERVVAHDVQPSRRASAFVARRTLDDAWGAGPRALLDEQRAAWRARWSTADIEIVGDVELTRAVRFGLFHLMATVADHGAAAVGARGLTGRAYAGHVFWDADVFVLPFLAATHPKSARAMLEYRIRRLPAARRRAAAEGWAGARFPWESAADGTEVTPTSGLNQNGEEVPILTGTQEEHITADVAWAAWNLSSWTGRWDLLQGPARDLVVDTARYWQSRVETGPDGLGHIDHVIGPDEYHEDVDDNAFTNGLAAWNLRSAAELVEMRRARGETDEPERWRETASRIATGYDPATGLYEQFRGYHDLAPLLVSSVGSAPFAADALLGRERLTGSQLIKQADALMLQHMLPESVAPGTLTANLEHYLPRTCHGSSLSPSIHAALLARVGEVERARSLLELAVSIDLEDLTGTTAGGLHVANFGGIWQAMVVGFAGVHATRPDEDVLRLAPQLPRDWEELRVSFLWHRRKVRLSCRQSAVHVVSDRPMRVELDHTVFTVGPEGRWLS